MWVIYVNNEDNIISKKISNSDENSQLVLENLTSKLYASKEPIALALFGEEDVTKQARKFQKEGVKTFQACSNFWKVKSTGKQALSIVFKTRILFIILLIL